ncbi:Cof-type HAD-IIB family hydrolase [Mycoplasma yeatsii]|uniref:Cof subfamily protein (Haloacid dehalogenase superfamily) n=1 Tax=Mycoplasma yeatsii TaxID=51365 RepID=A0ABU0NDT4_9MOLU|nr:Cof-type HAD-IIB family hydrolase [Mycoplasma yeatsii]MDQ0567603.1 Cof subfamily protein (haloacid dehalogenase superfamily) [Mycoplasma yeatsii]
MYKMIAIDLDGTVLSHKAGINKLTKQAIKRAKEKGIKIVIATGRNINTTRVVAEQLDLMNTGIPFVSLNGGQVFSYETDGSVKVRYTKHFTKEESKEIFELAMKHKAHVFAYALDENTAYKSKGFSIFALWMKRRVKRVVKTYDPKKDPDAIITKYICFGKRQNMRALRKEIEERGYSIYSFSYITNAKENVEINPKSINKGYGLEYIANELNIKPEEIIFFGDGENDIEALKFAGTGVVMKNYYRDNVRKAANDITELSCDDGGVGHYIYKHVLKEPIPKN